MLRQIVGRTAVFAIFAVLPTFPANGQEGAPRQFPRVVNELNGYTYSYGGLYLAAVETPYYVNLAHRTNLALAAGGGIGQLEEAFRLPALPG